MDSVTTVVAALARFEARTGGGHFAVGRRRDHDAGRSPKHGMTILPVSLAGSSVIHTPTSLVRDFCRSPLLQQSAET